MNVSSTTTNGKCVYAVSWCTCTMPTVLRIVQGLHKFSSLSHGFSTTWKHQSVTTFPTEQSCCLVNVIMLQEVGMGKTVYKTPSQFWVPVQVSNQKICSSEGYDQKSLLKTQTLVFNSWTRGFCVYGLFRWIIFPT